MHLLNHTFYTRLFLTCATVLFFQTVHAQIVDDTTRELYGTRTTKFYFQEDVFLNRSALRILDTSLHHRHYYDYKITNGIHYQYLGNLGTPMKPLYYQQPREIGYQFGYNAFDAYKNDVKQMPYYDTKSPHTDIYYQQGSSGEQRLNLLFAVNVNPYWNVGAGYNRFTSTKQFAVIRPRDFQADHHQIKVFSSAHTRNRRYTVLGNFNYMQHWLYENGGILPDPLQEDSGMFRYKLSRVKLFRTNNQAARNFYKSVNVHLYHQINALDSGNTRLQFYHEADWNRQQVYFRDRGMSPADILNFYKAAYFKDSLTTFYRYDYETLNNTIGIKGDLNFLQYAVNYTARNYSINDTNQSILTQKQPAKNFTDGLAGIQLMTRLSDSVFVKVNYQQLLHFWQSRRFDDSLYRSYNDYHLSGEMMYKKWKLAVNSMQHAPTLLQTRLSQNLALWGNDSLRSVVSHAAGVTYRTEKHQSFLQAGVSYTRVDRPIYFGPDSVQFRPVQSKDFTDYVQLNLTFRTHWRSIFLENELIYTQVFKNEVIRMPSLYIMPKLFFQNAIFKKAMFLQAGVEVFYKSAYKADAYNPAILSYHLQDAFLVPSYPLTNVFINFRLSRALLFLRVTNVARDLVGPGYFETPYYVGMNRSFQVGVTWRAFD